MFRFTGKPSSGSHSQYLAKVTHLVQSVYVELVQDIYICMYIPSHSAQHIRLTGHNMQP